MQEKRSLFGDFFNMVILRARMESDGESWTMDSEGIAFIEREAARVAEGAAKLISALSASLCQMNCIGERDRSQVVAVSGLSGAILCLSDATAQALGLASEVRAAQSAGSRAVEVLNDGRRYPFGWFFVLPCMPVLDDAEQVKPVIWSRDAEFNQELFTALGDTAELYDGHLDCYLRALGYVMEHDSVGIHGPLLASVASELRYLHAISETLKLNVSLYVEDPPAAAA